MVQAPALTELPEVYSNILNFGELQYCQHLFANGAWKMTNWSGSKPTEKRFWFMDLQEDPMFTDTIFQRLRQLTGKDLELRNVYANGQTFGHDGDFHTDGQDASHWTFLIYTSEITDGGFTLFRIPGTKLLSAVEPVRNTGVLFHAKLVHRGLAPSRECDAMRVSIAYKLRERSIASSGLSVGPQFLLSTSLITGRNTSTPLTKMTIPKAQTEEKEVVLGPHKDVCVDASHDVDQRGKGQHNVGEEDNAQRQLQTQMLPARQSRRLRAERLLLCGLAGLCFNGDKSKGDMRPLHIWLISYMSLPGEEGHNKGGVPQQDGQDDHDLDDVHEVVAHREAGRQGDESVLGEAAGQTLDIMPLNITWGQFIPDTLPFRCKQMPFNSPKKVQVGNRADLDCSASSSSSPVCSLHALLPQPVPLLFLSLQLSVDLPTDASQVKGPRRSRGGRGSQSP
ncbi:MAG: hypothetical protein FRX49_01181 [Trebouxia sp. A1-2]|nr:MAG: hypothetical protein FRX49_01181 [Trebouxia sp. A1-2]